MQPHATIIAQVCEHFQVNESELLSTEKTIPLPDARHILINKLYETGNCSIGRIKKITGFSENVIRYAIAKPQNDYKFKKSLHDFNTLNQ